MAVDPENAGLEEETGEKGLCRQNLLFMLTVCCKQKRSKANLTLAPRQQFLRTALRTGQQIFTLFSSWRAQLGGIQMQVPERAFGCRASAGRPRFGGKGGELRSTLLVPRPKPRLPPACLGLARTTRHAGAETAAPQ